MSTSPPSVENSFLITLSDADVYSSEMFERVEQTLLFETEIDSFVFRVVYGNLYGQWRDIFVPVNTERNYHQRGYDGGLEFKKVMTDFRHIYKHITPMH